MIIPANCKCRVKSAHFVDSTVTNTLCRGYSSFVDSAQVPPLKSSMADTEWFSEATSQCI